MVAASALLVAGCTPSGKHELHATLDADQTAGMVTMMCSQSSSGTCYGLFVTGSDVARITVAVGTTSGTSGITGETRFCLDVSEPTDGCKLKPLMQGEQIVRQEKAR